MMNRILVFGLYYLGTLVVLLALLAAEARGQISLTGTGATARPGETVPLTLAVSSPVAGLQWEMVPPAGVTSLLVGGTLASQQAGKYIDCAPLATGATRCVMTGLNQAMVNGQVATIGAVIAPTAPLGNMTMAITAPVAVDAAGAAVPVTGGSATWRVGVPFDLNGDGRVDAIDLHNATDQILGEQQCQTADFDLSGGCNLFDAALLIGAALVPGVAPPAISSIKPASAAVGQAVDVTITGLGFAAGAELRVEGTAVVVSNVVLVNATTITARFTVAPTATPRSRNVTVTVAGRTSNPVAFIVP